MNQQWRINLSGNALAFKEMPSTPTDNDAIIYEDSIVILIAFKENAVYVTMQIMHQNSVVMS